MRRSLILVLVLVFGSVGSVCGAASSAVLSDFEPGGPAHMVLRSGQGQVVKEHAKDGAHSFKLMADPKEYSGLMVDAAGLKLFGAYEVLRFEVFNPQNQPISFGVRCDDAATNSYGTRYNGEEVAAPGWSTHCINLTALNRSDAKGNTSKNLLDRGAMRMCNLFVGPSAVPAALYFDNVRLDGSTLPQVDGLRAIDFGPPQAPVYPGFQACTQKMIFGEGVQFGWINPKNFENAYVPDALSGDWGNGESFKMRLPSGKYEVNLGLDPYGVWARLPSFTERTLLINGKDVLKQTMNGAEFLEKVYYCQEDLEDLPGQDLWQKFIARRNSVHRFAVDVTDGVLDVRIKSPDKHGGNMTFLVVYPQSAEKEGRAWMDQLERERRDAFNAKMIVTVPAASGDEVAATAEDTERGFVAFVRHSDVDIAVADRPFKSEIARPLVLQAARGEREHGQIGLYPLKETKGLTTKATELRGPAGAVIPASAVRVQKVRNFLKRDGRTFLGNLLPYILMDFKTLDLSPGVTRGLWVTVSVPGNAAAGRYTGLVAIEAGGKAVNVPVELEVFPFVLERVTDITIAANCGIDQAWGGWYPELADLAARRRDEAMVNIAEHGMNAINDGPNAELTGFRDGKPQIDYTEIDAFLKRAVELGLTQLTIGYGGLRVGGVPNDTGPDCTRINEEQSQKKYGLSYAQVIRLTHEDYDRHMKDKGFPPRAHYFLDEPREEWGNIKSSLELVKLKTSAYPDGVFAAAFSGARGLEEHIKLLPLSMVHADKRILEIGKQAGRKIFDYDGLHARYNIGRWCFAAAQAGMAGYFRNGYFCVCSDPYFDFSDDEASWSSVWPGRDGNHDTVGWERTAEGVDDYRYLAMCQRLAKAARTKGKAAAQANAAEAFVWQTMAGIDIDNRASAALPPEGYEQMKKALAGHIVALLAAMPEESPKAPAPLKPAPATTPAKLAPPASVPALPPGEVGVVANIKVLSDKVADLSSLEAWKKSVIRDGMSDHEKAMAIWQTVTRYRFQTYPPCEGIESDGGHVHDPLKMFNVYGYCQCCCASAAVECLGRALGWEARGWSITTHSVAEVKYGDAWHMLDGAYGEYWINPAGQVASLDEINKAVMDWCKANPAAKGKLGAYGPAKGPALLAKHDWFQKNKLPIDGVWAAVMHAFECEKPGILNNSYVQGYRVNIQLRRGERLVRNWANTGVEINPGGAECMGASVNKPVQAALGDNVPGRVGNGTHEYVVPLKAGQFETGAMEIVNVAADPKGVGITDPAADGSFVVRMTCPYIYLQGQATIAVRVVTGGSVVIRFSDNNGIDFKDVATINQEGEQTIDLKKLVRNCYDYRLKFILKGQGTTISKLAIVSDIQHSQAALPALGKGRNTVTFSAGAPEGTVTYEGGMTSGSARPFSMFHPVREGIKEDLWNAPGGKGAVTVPLATPGNMRRIRISAAYRARDKRDAYTVEASLDEGKNWMPVGVLAGAGRTICSNLVFDQVPAGVTSAQLRFSAKVVNTLNMNDLRIDCDYTVPAGGFRPIQVTYHWLEKGQDKKDMHVARGAAETYTIDVVDEPALKSIALEWAAE